MIVDGECTWKFGISLMICVAQNSRIPRSGWKVQFVSRGGRSGQLSQRSCSDWWLVTASLDTLNLNIVAERISPSGTCEPLVECQSPTPLHAIKIDDVKWWPFQPHNNIVGQIIYCEVWIEWVCENSCLWTCCTHSARASDAVICNISRSRSAHKIPYFR